MGKRKWRGHIQADMSDRNPGEEGWVKCFKCHAKREFKVGPRGGIIYDRWKWEDGTPAPRCKE